MKLLNFAKLSLCASSLAGCASFAHLPSYPDTAEADILAIKHQIDCELADAVEKMPWLQGRAYAASLELRTTINKSLNPSVGLQNGLGSRVGQLFNIGISATGSAESFREGEVNFTGSFANLGTCPKASADREFELFTGRTGVTDWLDKIDSTGSTLADRPRTPREGPFGETIQRSELDDLGSIVYISRFTYVQSGTVNPSFTLIPVNFDSVTPAATLTAARNRLYLLTMTIARPPSTGTRPVRLTKKGIEEVQTAVTNALANVKAKELAIVNDTQYNNNPKAASDAIKTLRRPNAVRPVPQNGLTDEQSEALENRNDFESFESTIVDAPF